MAGGGHCCVMHLTVHVVRPDARECYQKHTHFPAYQAPGLISGDLAGLCCGSIWVTSTLTLQPPDRTIKRRGNVRERVCVDGAGVL